MDHFERRAAELVSRMTLAEKIRQMGQYQDAIPRLGLAAYKHGTEAAHGLAWLGKATGFPQPLGLAATWDKALLERVGEAIGTEARGFYARDRAKNALTLSAPTDDLERDPRWGRTEEGYGEDPYLTGHLAGSLVRGLQGRHPVYLRAVATLKHFWGNNQEVDRGTESTNVNEAQQHDSYLRPFEIAFREYGAQSMMTSYNSVNGVPANLNPQVNDLVRAEWGWKGFVVSDAGDVLGTKREHGYVDSWTEAVAASVRAGIDSITDDHEVVHAALEKALHLGLLTEVDLDEALKRTFRIRFLLGEFDAPELNPYAGIGEEAILTPAHAELSREATAASVVLLRNDGILPLCGPASVGSVSAPTSLAVLGPLADEVFRDWYSGSLPTQVSPLQGLRDRFPEAKVVFSSGSDHVHLPWGELEVTDWGWGSHTLQAKTSRHWLVDADDGVTATSPEVFGWFTKEVFGVHALANGKKALTTWNGSPVVADGKGFRAGAVAGEGRIGIDAGQVVAVDQRTLGVAHGFEWTLTQSGVAHAVAQSKAAQTTVLVLGSHPLISAKETLDRPDIVLPPAQEALLQAVVQANPNTVVVVVSGYPLSSVSNWAGSRAVVWVTHAMQALGSALADVLSGDVNPSGRSPLTWYNSASQLPPIKDYDLTKGRTYQYFAGEVQFPFGHGLSYTTFAYAELKASATPRQVSFRLTNTGSCSGDEIAQVYLEFVGADRPVPLRKLIAFEKIRLAAGESRLVTLPLNPEEFASWNTRLGRRDLPTAAFRLHVGGLSAAIRV